MVYNDFVGLCLTIMSAAEEAMQLAVARVWSLCPVCSLLVGWRAALKLIAMQDAETMQISATTQTQDTIPQRRQRCSSQH